MGQDTVVRNVYRQDFQARFNFLMRLYLLNTALVDDFVQSIIRTYAPAQSRLTHDQGMLEPIHSFIIPPSSVLRRQPISAI